MNCHCVFLFYFTPNISFILIIYHVHSLTLSTKVFLTSDFRIHVLIETRLLFISNSSTSVHASILRELLVFLDICIDNLYLYVVIAFQKRIIIY